MVKSLIVLVSLINFFYYGSCTPNVLTSLFRLYNGIDHFYTTDVNEANKAAANGYKSEGIIGRVVPNPTDPSCDELTAIYRLYNGKDHFYTTNDEEAVHAGSLGYHSEGITGYCTSEEGACDATLKLHRFYFPNGDHFYTTSEQEAKNVANGSAGPVTSEGVICYMWN